MVTALVKNQQLELEVPIQLKKPPTFFRKSLLEKYKEKLIVNPELSRSLVSFQANKSEPFYRWFKYKEAYSHEFINYVLTKYDPRENNKIVLDPFAGAGTTLTSAAKKGWNSVGIELLPVGIAALNARLNSYSADLAEIKRHLNRLQRIDLNDSTIDKNYFFKHIPITKKAFSRMTEVQLANFKKFIEGIRNEETRSLFEFSALAILEEISYTRKDGQYLRWDARSGRNLKSKFNKGKIKSFRDAINLKLESVVEDLKDENQIDLRERVQIIKGSCLEQMVLFENDSFDLVITSPPYCNRYDYTRTYALELAFLDQNEDDVKTLRQILLSATVENKSKVKHLRKLYAKEGRSELFNRVTSVFEDQHALFEVIKHLESKKEELNNKNIPGMVSHYFFEMTLLIAEMSRVLKRGGRIVMANDNVQYHGEEIPVDLILANISEEFGMTVENIWVLERGKGNSSQQMGEHGRKELRKCVYVWQKNK